MQIISLIELQSAIQLILYLSLCLPLHGEIAKYGGRDAVKMFVYMKSNIHVTESIRCTDFAKHYSNDLSLDQTYLTYMSVVGNIC